MVMNEVIVITGASSGFGALTARALARAGHIVYATMRGTTGRNASQVAEAARFASEHGVDLRTAELDVASTESVNEGIATIIAQTGRVDVVIHNAGHMSFGPAEAFTPEQFAALYDINVLSTQRVNRAVLPHMRARGRGLVVWVSSSSTRGGTPPYLSPYFAAKAAMDSLAVSYASELARWGIETSIIVPGAFTKGTNHFAHAGAPADAERAAEYNDGPYAGVPERALKGLASLEPPDADVSAVAEAIVKVVDTPFGRRPFRTHIDPSQDGAEIVNGVADRVRAEMFRRIGLEDLLSPRVVVGHREEPRALDSRTAR
jgi:NAD(P)-dependent dehydrogenase (short-subunit alcohol dehydrogenase family)